MPPDEEALSADEDDVSGELEEPPKVTSRPRRRAKPRDPTPVLPDDDPFTVIDRLDARGGIDGTRTRMSFPAMEAFRFYCRLPPFRRTHQQLRRQMQQELGYQPSPRSIVAWSAKYDWVNLAREYDAALTRWQFYREEHAREEAQLRQRKNARVLQSLAARQIQQLITEYNAPDSPPKIDPRTKQPLPPKKRTLAGLQALAQTYKVAVESERVTLGLPTTITDTKLDATVDSTQHVEVSLAEWRRRTSIERDGSGPSSSVSGSSSPEPAALPAPRPIRRMAGEATLANLQLSDDERDMLPDEWFEAELERQGRVVDADADNPLNATHSQQPQQQQHDDNE